MQNKALILIDFENEWITPESEYYIKDISKIIERVNELIDFCREENYKIIFTTHIEKDSKKEFAPKSKNIEIIDKIKKQSSDILIEKNKISPFYKTSLEKELENINDIVTCGILTNLCVRSFIQDAYDRDFNIKVIKDCCMSFDDETQKFTFNDLKSTRKEIEFINLNELIPNNYAK